MNERFTKTFKVCKGILLFLLIISISSALTFLITRYCDHLNQICQQQDMINRLTTNSSRLEAKIESLDKNIRQYLKNPETLYEASAIQSVKDEKE